MDDAPNLCGGNAREAPKNHSVHGPLLCVHIWFTLILCRIPKYMNVRCFWQVFFLFYFLFLTSFFFYSVGFTQLYNIKKHKILKSVLYLHGVKFSVTKRSHHERCKNAVMIDNLMRQHKYALFHDFPQGNLQFGLSKYVKRPTPFTCTNNALSWTDPGEPGRPLPLRHSSQHAC